MSNEIEILQKIKIENNKDFEIPEGFSANIGELNVEEGIEKTLTPGRYTFDGNETKRLKQNYINEMFIQDLLNKSFLVESYQRGYKWTNTEVTALLDDIYNFDESKSDFYCLQPIVVKRNIEDNNNIVWELIDGQQRLTTIYIILSYLLGKEKFNIEYKTRPGSSEFLNNHLNGKEKINTDNWDDFIKQHSEFDNIDNYHFFEAYKTIKNWFIEGENKTEKFLTNLTEKTKIIWYEVNDETSPTKIFQRINIGKIPLTNAELIKALFLTKTTQDFSKEVTEIKHLELAHEWDNIEYSLHNDDFWYFLTSGKINTPTRIEFIFDLISGKKSGKDQDEFQTFNCFFEISQNSDDLVKKWREVRDYFRTFEEWYNEHDLYHYIGFLIMTGAKIDELYKKQKDKTKNMFKNELEKMISKKVESNLNELNYGDSKIRNVLLLFNIETILQSRNVNNRFPFAAFKQNWDIEHIRSQTDSVLNIKNKKQWGEEVFEYLNGIKYSDYVKKEAKKSVFCANDNDNKINERLLNFLNAKENFTEDDFLVLHADITKLLEPGDFNNKDSIGNLALLDSATNRSYGNAFFPIKRKRVLNNDMSGIFVPICTKNVFSKSYSSKVDNVLNWEQPDADDYVNTIKRTLKKYLPEDPNEPRGGSNNE